jgi:hypothetical protein
MANSGTEGIAALREEAKKYGIMTTEAAKNSEEYLDAQERLKSALSGVSTELTSKLMPGITETINKVADFIANIDDWEGILTKVGYALAFVTAGLTAFLVISKGAAAIHAVSVAFKALTAAMAANPFTAIAVLITAVLVPALIYLFKNWDMVQTYLQQGVARLEYAFKWLGSVIKEKLLVAFSAIKAGGATLIDFIYGNIVRAVGSLLEVMGELPLIGEMFDKAAQTVNRLGAAMGNMAAEARRAVGETIETAKSEQQETQATLDAKLGAIDEAARARRADLEAKKTEAQEEQELLVEQSLLEQETINQKNNALVKSDKNATEKRKSLIEELIDKERWANATELQLFEARMSALSNFFGGFSQLLEVAGEKNRSAAIAGKVLASAEAGINTALAATKALSAAPPPFNYALMLGTIAAGLAQQIKIANTPIPSAETGGRFIVPNSSHVDDKLYKFNGGEEINVTPRGMTGQQESFNFIFQFEGSQFAQIINKLARSGELHTLALSSNL